MSRPTRACELKLKSLNQLPKPEPSRPTRACELKYLYGNTYHTEFVGHALHGRVS